MKRGHRRSHRWMWSLLVPVLACLLLAAWWGHSPPPPATALPAAFSNTPVEGRR